ncbi:MAG: hypothetical protein KKE16_07400 [Firmicutes bacterium]|nr:hypothetical protein [Bacillota bacterium]
MADYVYGLLHGVDEKKRIIAIKVNKKVTFYYMAKGMFQSFMQYFKSGIYVFMDVQETSRRYRGYTVKNVLNIEKVMSPHRQNPTIYYDVSIIKSGISHIMNTKKPKLFLDFEMSMPPYRNYEDFVSEIIQVGFILTDATGEIIDKQSYFIKTFLFKEISDRTKKFLRVEQEQIDSGLEYREFYDLFTKLLQTYKPMVLVWGQNDRIELKKMNFRHQLADFTPNTQFVDLLKLHKTYFNLKNDLGLFNAYFLYYENDIDKQKHDALEDARVTKAVFDGFLEVCNNLRMLSLNTTNELLGRRENQNETEE